MQRRPRSRIAQVHRHTAPGLSRRIFWLLPAGAAGAAARYSTTTPSTSSIWRSVYVLVGVGFNVVIGNLGQLAFANAAFYGIGAYATGNPAAPLQGAAAACDRRPAPLRAASPARSCACPRCAASARSISPSSRLAFGELMRWVYINADAWTLGSMGLHVPRPVLFG